MPIAPCAKFTTELALQIITSPSAVNANRLPCASPASAICSRYCVIDATRSTIVHECAPLSRAAFVRCDGRQTSLHLGAVELAPGHDLPIAALRLPQQLAAASLVALRRVVDLAGDRLEVAQCLEVRDECVARDREREILQPCVGHLTRKPAPRRVDIRRMAGCILGHCIRELGPSRIRASGGGRNAVQYVPSSDLIAAKMPP